MAETDELLYPIAEKYVSINGEGLYGGYRSAFIRFAGCNLTCSWCDTEWAQQVDEKTEWTSMSRLLSWLDETEVIYVTLTGGEPLLQQGFTELVETILKTSPKDRDARIVEIETNGSMSIRPLIALRNKAEEQGWNASLSFDIDCKLPGSGHKNDMYTFNYGIIGFEDAVKFVIASDEDLEEALSVIRKYNLTGHTNVIMSPAHGLFEPARIANFINDNKLNKVELQIQLHKYIWPDHERGK